MSATHYSRRTRTANIVPPFSNPFGSSIMLSIFLLILLGLTLPCSAQSIGKPEPLQIEFAEGSANILQPEVARAEAIRAASIFLEDAHEILLVKVRTQITEVPNRDVKLLRKLNTDRESAINALFAADSLVLQDQLQVMTSISLQSPRTVTFEFRKQEGNFTLQTLPSPNGNGIVKE